MHSKKDISLRTGEKITHVHLTDYMLAQQSGGDVMDPISFSLNARSPLFPFPF